ncbi:MAG: DUF2934 domain-containing protein [Proteobacteria bacterium]|nr:MAG: DUF2934 domain-containing protein [Pseudomonadota bacterium]QKK10414.1 MAG: DUF2934 domain-containing protein [Pseudomonadota bacterium]
MTQATPTKVTSRQTKKKATGKTVRSRTSRSRDPVVPIDSETRRSMIAEAAYYRAETRGFAPGLEEADWLAAESAIDTQFLSSSD